MMSLGSVPDIKQEVKLQNFIELLLFDDSKILLDKQKKKTGHVLLDWLTTLQFKFGIYTKKWFLHKSKYDVLLLVVAFT